MCNAGCWFSDCLRLCALFPSPAYVSYILLFICCEFIVTHSLPVLCIDALFVMKPFWTGFSKVSLQPLKLLQTSLGYCLTITRLEFLELRVYPCYSVPFFKGFNKYKRYRFWFSSIFVLSDSETIFFFYTDLIEKNGQQNLCLAKVCFTFHYNIW